MSLCCFRVFPSDDVASVRTNSIDDNATQASLDFEVDEMAAEFERGHIFFIVVHSFVSCFNFSSILFRSPVEALPSQHGDADGQGHHETQADAQGFRGEVRGGDANGIGGW